MKLTAVHSIRTRLLAQVLLASLLAVGIGLLGHVSLARVSDAGDDVVDRATPAITLGETRVAWAQFENIVNGAILVNSSDGKDAAYREADTRAREVAAGVSAYLASHPGAQQRGIVQEMVTPNLTAAVDAWTTQVKPTAGAVNPTGVELAEFNIAKTRSFETPAYAVTVALQNIAALDQQAIDARIASAQETRHSTVVRMWALAALGAAVMLAFGLALARSIVAPLRRTVSVLLQVADGDLTPRLEVSRRDELGQMAEALNTTLATVHDVVSMIEGDADRLSDVAATVSEQAGTGPADSSTTASDLAEMAASLNAMISLFTLRREDADETGAEAEVIESA